MLPDTSPWYYNQQTNRFLLRTSVFKKDGSKRKAHASTSTEPVKLTKQQRKRIRSGEETLPDTSPWFYNRQTKRFVLRSSVFTQGNLPRERYRQSLVPSAASTIQRLFRERQYRPLLYKPEQFNSNYVLGREHVTYRLENPIETGQSQALPPKWGRFAEDLGGGISESNDVLMFGRFVVGGWKPKQQGDYRHQFVFQVQQVDDNTRGVSRYILSTKSARTKDEALGMLGSLLQKTASQYLQVNVELLTHRVWRLNAEVGQGYSEAIERGHEEWVPMSAKTFTNCLYASFCMATKPEKVAQYEAIPRVLEEDNKTLKKRCKPENAVASGPAEVQNLCNYSKTPITVRNEVFEIIREYTPAKICKSKPRDTVHLQIADGHYVALKKKEEGDEDVVNIARPDVCRPIMAHFKRPDGVDTKLVAWDLETSSDNKGISKAYAMGMARGGEYRSFWGLGCIAEAFKYIHDNLELFDKHTFYAHNSGRFDILLVVREYLLNNPACLFKLRSDRCVCNNGKWLKMVLYAKVNEKTYKLTFLDSCAILPMSLERACIEFRTEHQKLTETVSHDDITLQNYDTFPQLKAYLEHDVLGLYEVMLKFSQACYEASNGNLNMTQCLTASTMTKNIFKYSYYKPKTHPIYQPPKDVDLFIREGYFGGRCEVFVEAGTKKENVFYIDETSKYPAEAQKDLPYGKHKMVPGESIDIGTFFGFIKARVKSVDFKRKPLHGCKHPKTGRLLFKHHKTWTTMSLFSEEIKMGLQEGLYQYEFLEGVQYKQAPVLRDYMIDCVQRKASARADGNDGLAGVYKLLANGAYGFWALNTHDRDGCVIGASNEVNVTKYFNSGSVVDYTEHGDQVVLKIKGDIEVKDTSVGISAAITSYARTSLWQLMDKIKSKGHHVYYCDTDSIMTSLNLNDHPDLMETYCWDGSGDALGSWKSECLDAIKKHFTKQARKKHGYTPLEHLSKEHKAEVALFVKKQIEASPLCFDEVIVCGLKYYSLKKVLFNGDTIEINKLKGGKAPKHSDFEKARETKQVDMTVTQFKCGVTSYMDKNEPFAIRIQDVHKTFAVQYTKAQPQEGSDMLIPFVEDDGSAYEPSRIVEFAPEKQTKIQFEETADIKATEWIHKLSNDELDGLNYSKVGDDPEALRAKRSMVRSYVKEMLENNGKMTVEYDFARGRSNGRLYGIGPCMQRMPSHIRGLLLRTQGVYDVDMQNAHPTLLLHFAKQQNLQTPNLEAYVQNREQFLQNSGANKKDVLIEMNRDRPTKTEALRALDSEFKMIQNHVWNMELPNFETSNTHNPKASRMNQVLCDLENRTLNRVVCKYKEKVTGLYFDGLMLSEMPDLEEINSITADLGIKWTLKPHSTRIEMP